MLHATEEHLAKGRFGLKRSEATDPARQVKICDIMHSAEESLGSFALMAQLVLPRGERYSVHEPQAMWAPAWPVARTAVALLALQSAP